MRRRSVLLLCDDRLTHADTVLDHVAALSRDSFHRVRRFNPRGRPGLGPLRLAEFDAVVVHYSLACVVDSYLAPAWREAIAAYPGLKLQFIQDEYRWVERVTRTIAEMGVAVLFSCLPPDEMRRIYGPRLPGVRLEPTLTGFVPRRLEGVATPAIADRPLHVVYRGRELPFWLGDLAQDKVRIAKGFAERAAGAGLAVDLAWREADRLYGPAWRSFLVSGRATLGTGSGASIADFDGSVERAVEAHLRRHPRASYEEVAREVLRPHEGNVRFDVVSPRLFEAAALRTALVQYPGWYSGIAEEGRHYLRLERDFSNFEEVAGRLRDSDGLQDLAERAHRDLVASGDFSYSVLTGHFDAVVDELAPARAASIPAGYLAGSLQARVDGSPALAAGWLRRRLAASRGRLGASLDRFLLDPGLYARKGGLALRVALGRPAARRVLAAWSRDRALRRRIPVAGLLEDLLELSLAAGSGLAASYDPATRTLELRPGGGEPGRGPAAVEAALRGGLETVSWDHTAEGGALVAGQGDDRMTIHVGHLGRGQVGLLPALAERHPELAAGLLLPLVTAPARALAAKAPGRLN